MTYRRNSKLLILKEISHLKDLKNVHCFGHNLLKLKKLFRFDGVNIYRLS